MTQWEYCYLLQDGENITYGFYQEDGIYTQDRPFNSATWGWAISALGLVGWEAISHLKDHTSTTWYFKRVMYTSTLSFSLHDGVINNG